MDNQCACVRVSRCAFLYIYYKYFPFWQSNPTPATPSHTPPLPHMWLWCAFSLLYFFYGRCLICMSALKKLLLMIGQIGGTLFTFIVALCKKMKKITPFYRVCAYTDIYQQSVVFYVEILYPSHRYPSLLFSVSRYLLFFFNFFTLSFSLVLFLHFNFFCFVIFSPIFSHFCLALISFCPDNPMGFSPFLYSDETWLHHPGR